MRGAGVPFPGESVDKFAGHRGGRGPACFALRLAGHDRPSLLSTSPRASFVPSTSGARLARQFVTSLSFDRLSRAPASFSAPPRFAPSAMKESRGRGRDLLDAHEGNRMSNEIELWDELFADTFDTTLDKWILYTTLSAKYSEERGEG